MAYTNGTKIYKYMLENLVGGGEFGEVWTATDLALDIKVAVKILEKSQCTIDERLLEAQIGSRLQHKNVVNIKGADVIPINGNVVVVIAMPYFEKGSITSHVNSLNFLDLQKAIRCLIDVLRGLEYLHENGYYHCDIKPKNILVGSMSECLLSDYGITCHSPSHVPIQPRQAYLPHIAAETISNNLYDARTDIYQMGLTAFRLINGISEIKVDFENDRDAFRENVLKGKIISASKYKFYVPSSIKRIINKAVSVNPDDRYQSALEMRRALERIHLLGDCTSDAAGNLLLLRGTNTYRYEICNIGKHRFSLKAFKRNQKSGKETHYTKYCVSDLDGKTINKTLHKFCSEIICE